jgi:hypothetical protein
MIVNNFISLYFIIPIYNELKLTSLFYNKGQKFVVISRRTQYLKLKLCYNNIGKLGRLRSNGHPYAAI